MSAALALPVALVLIATALLHALWALRIWWPIPEEARLARSVVGTRGITHMPGMALTWAVAALMLLGGLWPLALAGILPLPLPGWLLRLGGWIMTAIFLLRGLASWGPWPAEPEFTRLNRRGFGPLILALGLAMLALMLLG